MMKQRGRRRGGRDTLVATHMEQSRYTLGWSRVDGVRRTGMALALDEKIPSDASDNRCRPWTGIPAG